MKLYGKLEVEQLVRDETSVYSTAYHTNSDVY